MVAKDDLWEVAVDQHGFVATADARDLGIASHTLKLLGQRGVLERRGHGVYRFARFPESAADEYQQAVLWTGQPRATLSHETALDRLDLCDVNPDHIDVTVPAGARVRRQGGEGIRLHEEDIAPADVMWWEGIRCVNERTAIRQVISGQRTQAHLIRQAIETARARGRITVDEARRFTEEIGVASGA
ncbi:MAG: type IV toxin-antitoxin system AbiEi family antitoxin domain-containing protein [Nocardioides sp.]|uniref:type IV toxin-antitoxin system AbiEi family antitoxin domain-containing protein n=1 Tax=Nocardioides sp. TaxID=35761 RepID=UPI0039E4F710